MHLQIEIQVQDDNIDFVSIFHGRDKIELYTSDMLSDGNLKAQIPLRKGLNHVQIVARDHDNLLRYLPIRYWSATGIELASKPEVESNNEIDPELDLP